MSCAAQHSIMLHMSVKFVTWLVGMSLRLVLSGVAHLLVDTRGKSCWSKPSVVLAEEL